MWKKLKTKNKTPENPEISETQNEPNENERENYENPEMVESDSDSGDDVEEDGRETLEVMFDTLREGLSDSSLQQPVELLLDFMNSLREGVIDKEFLLTILKGCSDKEDVEKARAEGEIAGRNAAIIEEFKQRDEDPADEVPNLTGSFSSPYSNGDSIFDIARSARL